MSGVRGPDIVRHVDKGFGVTLFRWYEIELS
jgi:hypothetical protein